MPFVTRGTHAAVGHEVIIADQFGTDKSPLDVGMDFAGSLLGYQSFYDRPCLTSSSPAVRNDINPKRVYDSLINL